MSGVLAAFSGCQTGEVLSAGYVIDEQMLQLVPVGSSREQVELALGSPSTTATFNESQTYYYISQRRERPVAFLQPTVTNQRVLAVYFNGEDRVERIANYGLQDGRVFDFISRTTPTGGRDASFLGQILGDTVSGGNPLGRG
ncbi:outer membrane protein assembly factor BamE [Fulvimarina sp. MAC3]|uniref:outer membrane protein assembly factor BamE n=1 Tax=Fulvimarina sp. MAC3 TaxID=3148887 RepID=UPI0031FBC30E